MSLWGRTLVYLGLREESEDPVDWQTLEASGPDATGTSSAVAGGGSGAGSSSQRAAAAPQPYAAEVSNVRPLRSGPSGSGDRVAVVQVQVFDDVEVIGARYRLRSPVLFDVSGCSREVARRAVDFVAGLTFASRGSLRRTAPKAFLLVPEGVDIPLDERRRLAQLGYDVDGIAR